MPSFLHGFWGSNEFRSPCLCKSYFTDRRLPRGPVPSLTRAKAAIKTTMYTFKLQSQVPSLKSQTLKRPSLFMGVLELGTSVSNFHFPKAFCDRRSVYEVKPPFWWLGSTENEFSKTSYHSDELFTNWAKQKQCILPGVPSLAPLLMSLDSLCPTYDVTDPPTLEIKYRDQSGLKIFTSYILFSHGSPAGLICWLELDVRSFQQ